MLFKFFCTVLLLCIYVLKSAVDCVPEEDNYQIKDISTILEELKLPQIRIELDRLNKLLNEPMGELYTSITEQNRQSEFQNGVISQLSQLNERINKLTSLMPIQYPSSCEDVPGVSRRSGIHQIVVPSYSRDPFNVSCDEETHGGGWTTVLRREDGTVDFFRFWDDYKRGFGNISGEFFIGLDKLHFMTRAVNQELLITMEYFDGKHAFAKYDRFAIDGENEDYKLSSLGKYSGDAGDGIRYNEGKKFTTRDKDNDQHKRVNCAKHRTGAWWYYSCNSSNLMGKFNFNHFGRGINWDTITGYTSALKRVSMMIRPRRN